MVGTGIGGTYDLSRFQTILLQQKQKALAASVTANIIDDAVVFFADAQVAENKSFTQFKPVTTGVTLLQGAPFNPVAGTLGGITFGVPGLPKQYYNRNDSLRITAGLKGKLAFLGPSWNYEAAYVHSVNVLDQRQANVIYAPNVARAVAGGFNAAGVPTPGGAYSQVYSAFSLASPFVIVPALDPLSRTPNPTMLATLYGTESLHATSYLDSFDAKVIGSPFALPGGKVSVAVGGGTRKESLTGTTDPNGYVHANPNYCNDGSGPFVINPSTWTGGPQADPFPVACSSAARDRARHTGAG